MGGCATKFKVLKGDDRSVPAAPTKEAVAAAPDVVTEKGENVEADVVGEAIVNDDKVDDEATKRQSLSNLLNENQKEGAAETETETKTDVNPPSEPTKTEPLEPVEQESMEKKVPTVEAEPLSVEPEAAAAATATATADVAETEKKGTSAAAEDEVAK
ncbi:hypothetical protein HRI_000431500 [Hibiscus trionum]|uniref:Uncharacterized protein n=1 Tax=Hibiscus trionum TaxID=183268 RepID=A0A9W7LKC7_HIBTR|nr:hypothetical protein HRI_000431500 [Hibiscus trionum]